MKRCADTEREMMRRELLARRRRSTQIVWQPAERDASRAVDRLFLAPVMSFSPRESVCARKWRDLSAL
jgi:hypothetical protein